MSDAAALDAGARRRPLTIHAETLREGLVWLGVASSFFVMIEPAPYDFIMMAAIVMFVGTGLVLPRMLLPFLLLVMLYQLGAVISLTQVWDRPDTQMWTTVGAFLAITGCFYALFLSERTEIRARLIANAWIIAGVASGLLAIAGYFHLVPFWESLLKYNRAKGAFKDPNVFAPHLIFPAVVLMQRLYSSSLRKSLLLLAPLGVIAAGVLLSFSRGSWGHLIASALMMTVLTALAAPSHAARGRILVTCVSASLGAAMLVVVLLQIPSVGSLFTERASLEQNYDVEHGGRFSNHAAGFQLALDKPIGIGIFQFSKRFGADVHNTYLNAFMSYGWLGGIMVPALVILTLIMGFRTVLVPTPWRAIYICCFSTWVVLMVEAAVIDIDHWRHQWAILGMTWGFIAATAKHRRLALSARPATGANASPA